ncbi:MAG: hypothetical protein HUJ68_12010 [Clostridia bacterium]|nr:hypothetical protein [Clostridia bacterium]
MDYNLDPNVLVSALANKDNDSFGGNGLLFLFLLILFWGGGFGGFNNAAAAGVGVDAMGAAAIEGQIESALAKAQAQGLSDSTILTAIAGNKDAIRDVGNVLGVQTSDIKGALSSISNGIVELGYTNGQNTAQIIQAISNGNAAMSRQLADCCCTTQRNIDAVRYDLAQGLAGVNTNIDRSTCQLERYIDAKVDAAQMENRAGFQGIKDYLTSEKIAQLQNELQSTQLAMQNNLQTQTLINYIDSKCTSPTAII